MIKNLFISTGRARSVGVTLMELMIVMLVIAVLASIAYPSYVNQVRKSKRAVAKSALLDAANRQEQYYSGNRAYADAMNKLTGYTTLPGATILFDKDGGVTTVGADAIYAVSVAGIDAATCGTLPCFKIQAVPQNDQANDDCGTYTITSDNTRDVSNSTSTPASECW